MEYGYRLNTCQPDKDDYGFSYKYQFYEGKVIKMNFETLDCYENSYHSTEHVYNEDQLGSCVGDEKSAMVISFQFEHLSGNQVASTKFNPFSEFYEFHDHAVVLNYGIDEHEICRNEHYSPPGKYAINSTVKSFIYMQSTTKWYAGIVSYEAYPINVCVSLGGKSIKATPCSGYKFTKKFSAELDETSGELVINNPDDAAKFDFTTTINQYSDPFCNSKPNIVKHAIREYAIDNFEPKGNYKYLKYVCVPNDNARDVSAERAALPYGYGSVYPRCVIGNPKESAFPTFSPTLVPVIISVSIPVTQQLDGVTKEDFNENAQYVFKKAVMLVLKLPIANAKGIDDTVVINSIKYLSETLTNGRRLAAEKSLVIDYNVVVLDITKLGFKSVDDIGKSVKKDLTAATEDGGFTATLRQVATVEGNDAMLKAKANTPPVVEQPQVIKEEAKEPEKKTMSPVGAIVGGVIGGIAVIAIIVAWYAKSKGLLCFAQQGGKVYSES